MAENKILFAEKDDACFIKMVGAIRYTISSGFDELVGKLTKECLYHEVLIDLSDVRCIDSTNLGLLARIAAYLMKQDGKKATLLSTNNDINTLLDTMGFDDVFVLIDKPEAFAEAYDEVAPVETDRRGSAQMMLQAHKALVEMNEKNQPVFKNVIDMLEKDLEQSAP